MKNFYMVALFGIKKEYKVVNKNFSRNAFREFIECLKNSYIIGDFYGSFGDNKQKGIKI